jgi:transcriptional regulator with XRE-family HTH domain
VPFVFHLRNVRANMVAMPVNNGNPAHYFGKQMKKERLARRWTLRDLSAITGLNVGYLSLIENGKRPPTLKVAEACDLVFTERKGYFVEYYNELQEWSEVPAAFKDWSEHEDQTGTLRDWWPSFVSGLLQTEDYARAQLRTYPGVTDEIVAARLAARMERQRRLFARDVLVWFIVDEFALYRLVGSPQIMSEQMHQLAVIAGRPNVTMQILPAVAHPAGASGFIVADDASYVEHAVGGFVYTGETASAVLRLFYSIHAECSKASETLATLERMAEAWTGGSPVFQTQTAARA